MMRSDEEQVNQKLGEGSEDVFYEFGEVLEQSAQEIKGHIDRVRNFERGRGGEICYGSQRAAMLIRETNWRGRANRC